VQNLASKEDAHVRLRQGMQPLSHQLHQLQIKDSSMDVDSLLALVDTLPELNNLSLTRCRLLRGPPNPHFGSPGPPRSKICILTQSVSFEESDAQCLSLANLSSLILTSHIEVLNLRYLPELNMASPFMKHAAATMTSLTIIFAFRLYAGTTLVSPEPPPPIRRLQYLHLGGVSRETLDWTTQATAVLARLCEPGVLRLKVEQQFDYANQCAQDLEACRSMDQSVRSCEFVDVVAYGVHHGYRNDIRVMMPQCQQRGILGVEIELSSWRY
jgi:hypothetical protein